MKKHAVWKHISLLLAVIILFMAMPFPKVNALVASSSAELENTNTQPIQQELEPILTESQLPTYIDYSGAVAAKHVERLESEEELDTLVFRNQDGTYTTYLFDLPIKYVAENGSVQEKDISLVQSSTAYEVASNDIDVTLPFDVSEGIQVSYGTQNVTLSPVQNSTVSQQLTNQSINAAILESSVITANTAALNAAENTVTYAQAFDNSINIVYTPLLNGIKEDIVLNSYTGIHTFQFLIETDGMGVYYDEEQELYYINSSETAEGGFNIGRVYIYDKNQRVDIGSMTVTTVEENQTYLLTITANESFLTDEETVYPVTIDPTLTFRQESQIRDAIVYSNYPNGAYGGYQYAYVGKYSNYGTGRLLVGFGDLSSFLSRIPSALDIQSANLYLYCGTSSAASTLDVYYNDNLWTESSVKYSTIDWSKVSKSSRSTNIPTAAGWYSIDIKTIVQDWKYNSSTPTKGIVIQNSDEATASKVKCFRTKEYAAAHNGVSMPYLAVTYDGNLPAAHPDDGVYMIKNKNSGKYLDVDYGGTANETNVSQHAYNGADNQKWYLEFLNDGLYSVRPLHAPAKALNVYNAGTANNTNVQIYSFNPNDNACLWTIRYDAEGHYYFVPFCSRNSLLAVQNSSTENSANVVIQNADYNADNQRWYLEKCSEANIQIYDNSGSIYDSGSTYTINVDTTASVQLNAIYVGSGNNQNFTWTSSNPAVASINNSGLMTPLKYGSTVITANHYTSGTSVSINIKVEHTDSYTNILISQYGFSDETAALIRRLYDVLKEKYPSDSEQMTAWRFTRLLGGFSYSDSFWDRFKWNDVAGIAVVGGDEQYYFTTELGFSAAEYTTLKDDINTQHNSLDNAGTNYYGKIDFAHQQITISAKLAYYLHIDGDISNFFTLSTDLTVSYLAGWLGDATLKTDEGITSFDNPDYMADLDAENIAHSIYYDNKSLLEANIHYYDNVLTSQTRAHEFLELVPLTDIKTRIFKELCDKEIRDNESQCMTYLKDYFPDTYNFIKSLENNRQQLGDYS